MYVSKYLYECVYVTLNDCIQYSAKKKTTTTAMFLQKHIFQQYKMANQNINKDKIFLLISQVCCKQADWLNCTTTMGGRNVFVLEGLFINERNAVFADLCQTGDFLICQIITTLLILLIVTSFFSVNYLLQIVTTLSFFFFK